MQPPRSPEHALQVAGQAAAGLETRDGEAGRRPVAGRRGRHRAPGAGLGAGTRPGCGAPAGHRAGAMVAPARPLGHRLPAARRGRRARWGGRPGVVHRAVLAGPADGGLQRDHQLQPPHPGPGRLRGSAPPAPLLARALAWRAGALANLGRVPEAAEEGRHALALARELGDPAGEAYALYWLATAAGYVGNLQDAEAWLRQAQRIDQAAIPGWIARHCTIILARVLGEIGEATEAQRYCADALALARQAGALYDEGECLLTMALLELVRGPAGRGPGASCGKSSSCLHRPAPVCS